MAISYFRDASFGARARKEIRNNLFYKIRVRAGAALTMGMRDSAAPAKRFS